MPVSTTKSKGIILIFPKGKWRVLIVSQNLSVILRVTQRSVSWDIPPKAEYKDLKPTFSNNGSWISLHLKSIINFLEAPPHY